MGSVLTSEGSYLDKDPSCRRAAPAQGIAVLGGDCLARRLAATGANVSFGALTGPNICTMKGFGDREPNSTWTISTTAILVCPVPVVGRKRPTRIEIDAAAFLNKVVSQRAIVSVNGTRPLTFIYDAAQQGKITVPLADVVGRAVEIRLSLPDARSPLELGLSGNARKLGLALRSLEFK